MELRQWLAPDSKTICRFINRRLSIPSGFEFPQLAKSPDFCVSRDRIRELYCQISSGIQVINNDTRHIMTGGGVNYHQKVHSRSVKTNTTRTTRTTRKTKTRKSQKKDNAFSGGGVSRGKSSYVVKSLVDMYLHSRDLFTRTFSSTLPYYSMLVDSLQNHNLDLVEQWINNYGLDLTETMYQYGTSSLGLDTIPINSIYGRFTSTDIQKVIENQYSDMKEIEYRYQDYRVSIKFGLIGKSLRSNFCRRLGSTALLMLALTSKQSSNTANITILCTSVKKTLSWKKGLLPRNIGSREVNTGSSFVGSCRAIFLWRLEEVEKVLTHEIGHCVGLDCYPVPESVTGAIQSRFNIGFTEVRPCETWVEMWACVINLVTNSYYIAKKEADRNHQLGVGRVDQNHELAILQQLYQWEVQWSLFQVAKILHYFGFKKFSSFYGTDFTENIRYSQTTSVVSYYILKAILWCHLDRWIEWCHSHPDPFRLTPEYWDSYLEMLWSCVDHPMTLVIDYYIDIITDTPKDRLIAKSFRMTCVEIVD